MYLYFGWFAVSSLFNPVLVKTSAESKLAYSFSQIRSYSASNLTVSFCDASLYVFKNTSACATDLIG
ncbi:MAG: hypothetical protein ACK50A_13210 [Sphingobacteriaceae bacterium]